MQKIRKLSALEAQKIAAGQVVERPVNVVKELVENSLDAGATAISIWLEKGGQQSIKVVDNGCGMSKEDAVFCFQHHATSKITSVDDLQSLYTFGFRGEALSSIAAVSNINLQTRLADQVIGTLVQHDPSGVKNLEEIGCQIGTSISVSDLFFNMPARKKFFKKPETDQRTIIQLFQALCLAYQHVHFQLFTDGNMLYNCPPTTDTTNRLIQLFDYTFGKHCIALQPQEHHGFKLTGVISDTQLHRYNKNNLYFFINKRWVKNPALSKAAIKGYGNILPPDKFPLMALFIECCPTMIDINIHPRKEEVLFLHPGHIERLMSKTIKTALEQTLSAQLQTPPAIPQRIPWQPTTTSFTMPTTYHPDPILQNPIPQQTKHSAIAMPQLTAIEQHATNTIPQVHDDNHQLPMQSSTDAQTQFHTVLGVAHKTYIMLEHPEGILFVDQHAAHERILYEKFGKTLRNAERIALLFPVVVHIAKDALEQLQPLFSIFQEHNIEIECFAQDKIIIKSAPLHAKNLDWQAFIQEFLESIEQYDATKLTQISKSLQAQLACKAAVKAGDTLSSLQIQQLLADLDTVDNRTTCPHGRPTTWLLRLYELEKKFKRVAS